MGGWTMDMMGEFYISGGKEEKRLESLLGFYFRRLLLSGVPWTCVAKPYCFL
jgi:hypothetical protein